MSRKYRKSSDVPATVLADRLDELALVIARNRGRESLHSEFYMRIPAEADRDADLVMSDAARRLREGDEGE